MKNPPLKLRYVILATLLGNTLEWYEYISYIFLGPVFVKLFFPSEDPWASVIHLMLGYMFGFVLRPLGGIFFGSIGDRYGRKVALIQSILLMSIPTLLIGLLPSYAQIGVASTLLLLFFRLFQGLAAGGEVPSSMTFIIESSPVEKRGFYGSFVFFGMILGIFLGCMDYFLLYKRLSPESLYAWGWRTKYIIGALIGCAAFFIRLKLHETKSFQTLKECHEIIKYPVTLILHKYKKNMLEFMGVASLGGLLFHFHISFSFIYFSEILHLSMNECFKYLMAFLLSFLLFLPLAGWISARISVVVVALSSASVILLLSFPLYWMLQQESLRFYSLVILGVLTAFYLAPTPAIYCELFPAKVRLTGIGIGYNLVVATVAGVMPLLSLSLIHHTGYKMAPAPFLTLGALLSITALRSILKKQHGKAYGR